MIGSSLWRLDEQDRWGNDRTWEEYDVRAETTRSWILMPSNRPGSSELDVRIYGIKVPKKDTELELQRRGFLTSKEELQREKWFHKNRAKILRVVENSSAEVLWKIAEIIGYTEDT